MNPNIVKLKLRNQLRKIVNHQPIDWAQEPLEITEFLELDLKKDNHLRGVLLTANGIARAHKITHAALQFWRYGGLRQAHFQVDWNDTPSLGDMARGNSMLAKTTSANFQPGMGLDLNNLALFLTNASQDRAVRDFYISQEDLGRQTFKTKALAEFCSADAPLLIEQHGFDGCQDLCELPMQATAVAA